MFPLRRLWNMMPAICRPFPMPAPSPKRNPARSPLLSNFSCRMLAYSIISCGGGHTERRAAV
jgi:hypothetical protein